ARQLASHAALHTQGGELGRALLETARRLHATLEWSATPAQVAAGEPAGLAAPAPPASDRAGTGGFELTDREEEVVRLLLAGHSYKEVAGLLFISTKTVERHVTNTRAKIGAGTRAEYFTALRRYFTER
ncbi:MAG: LuxR family transcriptional regulator, partial [Acidimicrobiia bacterium]|nr:LuxR family transcriptional regulator [Acidimicrobiia bacterium]